MGRSSPAASVPPRRWSAAPSSSAKNGLPPDASQSLISTGRANVASRRLRNSSCVAPRLRPPTRTVRSRSSGTARRTHSGTSSRTASTVATCSWSSRATANRMPTATPRPATGRRRRRGRERGRRRAAAARRGTQRPPLGGRRVARTRRAAEQPRAPRRWIGGSSGKTSATTSPSMSVSARNENPASACEGRDRQDTKSAGGGEVDSREPAAPSCRSRARRRSRRSTAADRARRRDRGVRLASSSLPTTCGTPASKRVSKPRFYDPLGAAERDFRRVQAIFICESGSRRSTPAHHLPVEPVGVDDDAGELELGERRRDARRPRARCGGRSRRPPPARRRSTARTPAASRRSTRIRRTAAAPARARTPRARRRAHVTGVAPSRSSAIRAARERRGDLARARRAPRAPPRARGRP